MLGNIAVSDKGTITVTNSTFLKDLDALKVVSGAYKLNVTDINVTDALAIKAPSKDATLSLTIKDTASNIAANWDKLQALVKAKTLTNITLTDGSSSLLTMTAAQLKANADVLKVVTGDYKLSVIGVAAADVAKTLTTKNIYSVEVKDTVANILKNLPAIKTAVTAAKIQSVIITDATNPALSIADIFTLTTTLPNVTLAAGVKFNVKDTASNIVAHARYDIADVIKNAGSIALSDKTPPNLTLADATTLKGLTGLAAGTKYNVADGGAVIAAQAALSGEKVLADSASVVVNKNFTIVEAKAVSAIKSLAKGSAYSINDTAANILTQSALAGETILGKANAVNVVDTSANILAKLDQLQVLAKAGKIADIKFTDTQSGPLPLTDAHMLNNAEAIGKIISQRTLPTLAITKPVTPSPLGPTLPPMKTLRAWSAETTIGPIVDGSYQFRPYMRADRWGNMIGDIVTPASSFNPNGKNQVSLYLMAQDGLGNSSVPVKVADFNTSLGGGLGPKNGGLYLLKPNIYSSSYTPSMIDNQLAVWMEQQPDMTYSMKYLPFNFSPAAVAGNSPVSPLSITGTPQTLVSGIDPNIKYFDWINTTSSNKFLMEYETLTSGSEYTKDIYINTFTVNGTGNNVVLTTSGPIVSGANLGAKKIVSSIPLDSQTFIYNSPDLMTFTFGQEKTLETKTGLMISTLDPSNGLVEGSDRFLEIGTANSGVKITAFAIGAMSNDSSITAPTVSSIALATSTPAISVNEKPIYKMQFYKGDVALSGTAGSANFIQTDSLTINNPVKAMWNQAGIGNNTSLFAFQDGNVVHAVQVGSDGKIIADDQFAIPEGATFDRYRPLNSTKSTLYEFIWREPTAGSTTGETTIKSRIYDARANTPLILEGYSGNSFNLLAGGTGNDAIFGRGNDVIAGGPGDDIISGSLGGKDVVSYLGKSSDYLITPNAQYPFKFTIKDLRRGSPDGTDTLINVSSIRFSDKNVPLQVMPTLNFDLNLPPNSTFSEAGGLTPDGNKMWGQFQDQNGSHAFITKTDGSDFVDLTPQGAMGVFFNYSTSDGTKAWGNYQDQSNHRRAFIIKTDGTDFVDLTPQGAIGSSVNYLTPDGTKACGAFQDLNNQQHAFIIKTDGTGFVDLTPQGAIGSSVNYLTPDGTKALGYFQDQNGSHAFITKTDGTGFVDLTPQAASFLSIAWMGGLSADGSNAWGNFLDKNNNSHPFVIKTDGTGFVDLIPQSATSTYILDLTPDGTRAWGYFQDQNRQSHGFIIKTDGTGFVNLTPQSATSTNILGLTPDGTKAWGQFQDQNFQSHAFITKTDGTGFVDLTPQGIIQSWLEGLTTDGTQAYGGFITQNGYRHIFITNIDGTGFVDLTPSRAVESYPASITSDGKLSGTYMTSDKKWHGYITKL